jgi:hypothetical protein
MSARHQTGRIGLSLTELIFATAMFSSMLVIVFFFFRYGSRAFVTATQRQGVQSEALRVMDSIQSDLARTAISSVLPKNSGPDLTRQRTINSEVVQRDVLSFVTLQNWTNPQDSHNFNVVEGGQPIWNRYLVYYATRDQDKGLLFRLKIDPSPPPISPLPMLNTKLNLVTRDNPDLNAYDGRRPECMTLAKNVHEFSVLTDGERVQISLKLRERRQNRPDGGPAKGEEAYELQLLVRPQNTYPTQEN